MSKAYNRFQDAKALIKARQIVKQQMSYLIKEDIECCEKTARRIKKNRKMCSCEMCRNPRRSKWANKKGKLTIQELKNI